MQVTDADTAVAVGSGDVEVLATPRIVALCEAATVAALAAHLDDGETTVGTRVELDHVKASPVGALVTAYASVDSVDGRTVVFAVEARDGDDVVARGRITRVAVNRSRFGSR